MSLALKEVILSLPDDIVGSTTSRDIIFLLMDQALSKAEYYRSKTRIYEDKYGVSFTDFKVSVEKSSRESFSAWDDLLVWEGYDLASREWSGKYEELKACWQ